MNGDVTMSERLNEVNVLVGKLRKEFPSETGAFLNFLQKATDGEGLDVRTKELINVGLSVGAQCEWCIAFHVRNAVEAGAMRAQIISAGFMAVVMHGGPALMYLTPLLKAADEFAKA